jgi:hypothetical protein
MIVEKRLIRAGLTDVSASDYFPPNEEQENSIKEMGQKIAKEWKEGTLRRGYRPSDDVARYAKAEYIRLLGGTSKDRSTFSYAGFNNMVDISSGVIRCFLEPAARMFSSCVSQGLSYSTNIPPGIQDGILKQWSQEFLLADFDKLKSTESSNGESSGEANDAYSMFPDAVSVPSRLYNLINALGETFQARLIDPKASERRLISILLTTSPPRDLEEILSLGVEYGYLQVSTIGSKEGIGRRKQYILNRRLAPYFKLDPGGYAAYLSVTPDDLRVATIDPKIFLAKKLKSQVQAQLGGEQPSLFAEE